MSGIGADSNVCVKNTFIELQQDLDEACVARNANRRAYRTMPDARVNNPSDDDASDDMEADAAKGECSVSTGVACDSPVANPCDTPVATPPNLNAVAPVLLGAESMHSVRTMNVKNTFIDLSADCSPAVGHSRQHKTCALETMNAADDASDDDSKEGGSAHRSPSLESADDDAPLYRASSRKGTANNAELEGECAPPLTRQSRRAYLTEDLREDFWKEPAASDEQQVTGGYSSMPPSQQPAAHGHQSRRVAFNLEEEQSPQMRASATKSAPNDHRDAYCSPPSPAGPGAKDPSRSISIAPALPNGQAPTSPAFSPMQAMPTPGSPTHWPAGVPPGALPYSSPGYDAGILSALVAAGAGGLLPPTLPVNPAWPYPPQLASQPLPYPPAMHPQLGWAAAALASGTMPPAAVAAMLGSGQQWPHAYPAPNAYGHVPQTAPPHAAAVPGAVAGAGHAPVSPAMAPQPAGNKQSAGQGPSLPRESELPHEAGATARGGAATRGPRRPARLWVHIYLHMQAPDFDLVPMLIGRGGCNMRKIADKTRAKIRIRGKGSGHLEMDNKQEAPTPLMVAVTTDHLDYNGFKEAVRMTIAELQVVSQRFQNHCEKKQHPFSAPFYSIGLLPDGAEDVLADVIEGVPVAPPPAGRNAGAPTTTLQ